jgi:hypothetical protein
MRLFGNLTGNLFYEVTKIDKGFSDVTWKVLRVAHLKLYRKRSFVTDRMKFLDISTQVNLSGTQRHGLRPHLILDMKIVYTIRKTMDQSFPIYFGGMEVPRIKRDTYLR